MARIKSSGTPKRRANLSEEKDRHSTNKLTPTLIPNLQPPCVASPNLNDDGDTFLANLPPPATSSSTNTTPWYRHTQYREEDEDLGKDNGPLDMDLAGESTPLTNRFGRPVLSSDPSNISFMSPISKLDNLHLESEIDLHEENSHNDDDEYDHNAFSLGDKTLANESGSDVEFKEDDAALPPVYVNRRKRHHQDSPDVIMITPKHELPPRISNDSNDYDTYHDPDHHMSISNTTASHSKISFSNSDCTPCPVQPKRKRLKFKHSNESTPSVRNQRASKLLNLSSSKKTDVNSIITQLKQQHHESDSEEEEENSSSSPPSQFSAVNRLQSTPISQSTPANSRSSTPPNLVHQNPKAEVISEPANQESTPISDNSLPGAPLAEYGAPINGYKFVEPARKVPQYSYQTPNNNRHTSYIKHAYTRNDYTPLSGRRYEIVGEFPVTSAGLMDESGDIHIGDKRINDPYFKRATPKVSTVRTPHPTQEVSEFTKQYFNSLKLPILPPNFELQERFSTHVLTQFVSQKSDVIHFYRLLAVPQKNILELLKSERIRWHPDKWAGKFIDGLVVHFNIRVLDKLSQVLNELIEDCKE